MEPAGAFSEGEWDFFRKMFATEEHDFQPQFLSQSSLLLGEDVELNNDQSMFYSFGHANHISNSHYISQENSYTSNSSCNYYYSYPDNVLANNYTCKSMDFYMDEKNFGPYVPHLNDIVMEENVKFNEDAGSDHRLETCDYSQVMEPDHVFPTKQLQMQLKRKLDHVLEQVEVLTEDKINNNNNNKSDNQKKKSRVSKDGQGCMKNARSKKNQKLAASNGEEAEETTNITGSNGHSSSSTNISEDDNASQENSGGATSGSKSALNSNGKTRASRGSATDPQSLYARKRRERINERLKILQNLVPNGTKVDISTMLEEAVNYVKFLQLQIKLLSSDDMWMYAPLAYTGLDIGLNLNVKSSPPL